MARKPKDLFGLEREDAVRKQKIKLLSGLAAAIVVVIIILVAVQVSRNSSVTPSGGSEVTSVSSEVVLPTEEPTPTAKAFPQVVLPDDEAFSEKITILITFKA